MFSVLEKAEMKLFANQNHAHVEQPKGVLDDGFLRILQNINPKKSRMRPASRK